MGAPKAGFTVLGRRIEARALYRLKAAYLRATAGRGLPAGRRDQACTLLVRWLTLRLAPETRRRLEARGWLRPLRPLLSGGSVGLSFGAAEGLRLSTAHIDLAGAQSYGVVRGVHEMMFQEALRRVLPPGGTFWDVGANIGFMTLVGAQIAGPAGRVVAIEPEPANVAAIEANAALNGLGSVTVLRGAAASTTGPVEVIAVADTLWTRLASVGEHPLERERLVVDGYALDDLVGERGLPVPDVIKIDVEGGEVEVLRGMTTLLREHRPVVIAEMHGKQRQVVELLTAAGYEAVNLDGPEPVAESHDQVHLLARPRERPAVA